MAPAATPLDTWVSDNLLVLLGASDSTTVAYFQQLAATSPTPDHLAHTLTSNGLPATTATTHFARDLFARVPRPTSRSNEARQADTRRKLAQEKQQLSGQRFSLVLDDDLADPAPSTSTKARRTTAADKGKAKERDLDRSAKRSTTTRRRDQAGDPADKWGSEDDDERDIKRRREHDRAER